MSAAQAPLAFEGRAAIITGAASGIGLALARELAARGANLALADRDSRGLAAAHEELAAIGNQVVSEVLDVADDAQVRAAAAAFDAQLGPIHLLFNNAGIDMSGALDTLTLADWRRAFDINVFGVVSGLRHFLPLLQRHGGRAHVVNTASGAGFWVNSEVRMGAYAATKYAVVAISEALEQELAGTNVGVSVLCPGPVATSIAERSANASPQLRASIAGGASPESVAQLVLAGIATGEFYIFTPTRIAPALQQRHARILSALSRAGS